MIGLRVLEAGLSSTIQDAGRLAFQPVGVSPAGFADPLLAALGNALVGNPLDAAVLEWTAFGDTLEATAGPLRVAIAAWTHATVDGSHVPNFRAFFLEAGQTLALGRLHVGRHGVLAVAGGIQTPIVLGSRSAHARTGVGGQRLTGDALVPARADPDPATPRLHLAQSLVPAPSQTLRILPAPQRCLFADDALARLVDHPWHVVAGDRMGTRLRGPHLQLLPGVEPVSEGVVTGALQVPPSGQPIVLGPDRQTIGGYAKLAVVVTADLRHLAQLRDGSSVRFALVDLASARAAALDAEGLQAALLTALAPVRDFLPTESACLLRLLS